MAAARKTTAKPKTVILTKDQLTAEVQAVMDRAVRVSRDNGWCERFSEIAGSVFQVPANQVLDSDGFDCRGRNADGFNKYGIDREGYDREGYKRGFNREGYDREGYSQYGENAEGLDRLGRDRYRFDSDGYDQEGYNCNGTRAGGSRDWYNKQAAKPESEFRFDRNYSPRPRKRTPKIAT